MAAHDVLFHLAGSSELSGLSKPRINPNSCDKTSISSHNSFSTPNSFIDFAPLCTKMDINIDNYHPHRIYTNGDAVEGTVTIWPVFDVKFDSIEIILTGTLQTRFPQTYLPLYANHPVISLTIPIDEALYPVRPVGDDETAPRVFKAGEVYTFPFHFVIPDERNIIACRHDQAPDVLAKHLQLPPSLGSGCWGRDDMVSDATVIRYAVKARLWRDDGRRGGNQKMKLAEYKTKLLVLPTTRRDPALLPVPQRPLSDRKKDRIGDLYRHRATTMLRKGLFGSLGFPSSKLGHVVVVAGDGILAPVPEPISIWYASGSKTSAVNVTPTTARVHLRFEPAASDVPPPEITDITAKLDAHTYVASAGAARFPDHGNWIGHDDGPPIDMRMHYEQSAALPLANDTVQQLIEGFQWQATEDAERPQVRHSFSGTLDIPVAMTPEAKMYLPTFHSCHVSRVYILRLSISFARGPRSSTRMKVAVPVQIITEQQPQPPSLPISLPTYEEAQKSEPAASAAPVSSAASAAPGSSAASAAPAASDGGVLLATPQETDQLPEYKS